MFGTTGAVVARAPDDAGALAVGAVRLAVGGPLLMCTALICGSRLGQLRPHLMTVVGAGFGAAAFQLAYFVATTRTGVALGTVVTIGSGPVFSGVIHSVATRRPPTLAWTIGTVACVSGVAVLALTGDRAEVDALGLVAALGSGLGWASFTTLSKRQISAGVDPTLSLGATFATAAVLTAPLLVVEPMGWLSTSRGLWIALYLGVGTLAIAYVLYGRALAALPAPTVITLTLFEPVTAAVLAAVVVDERVAAAGWVGIAFVLAGLLITARASTVNPNDTDPGPRCHPGDPTADAREPARRRVL